LLLTLLLWETIDRKTKNNTHIDYAIPTEKKAMVRCPSTPLARWTRLVTAPAVALDTTQPIQRSRGVSLNTTTLQPHSLQRYRSTHTFTWSTLCKYDVIHKPEAHNVSQRRQRRTEPGPRTKKNGEDRACSSGDRICRLCSKTDRQANTETNRHAYNSTPPPSPGEE